MVSFARVRRALLQPIVTPFIIICCIAAQPGTAAIFGSDDRQYVATARGSPFAAVGLVTRGDLFSHYTTGTLIDECDVLTSQHLLGHVPPIGRRLKFTAAVGSADEVSSRGTVIAAGGTDRAGASSRGFAAVAGDWLLIRLDRCLGATLGFASLRAGPARPSELAAVESAGYPMDRGRKRLMIDPSCRVRAALAAWLNDCAALHGNSGGPIFRIVTKAGRQQLEIFAIQSAGIMEPKAIAFTPGWDNQATPASAIVPLIPPPPAPYGNASRDFASTAVH